MSPVRIVEVRSPDELTLVRTLFEEYWTSFGFTPCFQGFEAELAGLPGNYAAPSGRLALAYGDSGPVGCIAMRSLGSGRCEAKRLYIRPEFRGHGLGRELLAWLLAEARSAGYREMVCDTMPQMREALAMYERFGFQRIGPYSDPPTPGAIYLRLGLE